ncbi:MAG: hypothetical protein ACLP3K_08445 [Candidatus Acidiferrales bacterium]
MKYKKFVGGRPFAKRHVIEAAIPFPTSVSGSEEDRPQFPIVPHTARALLASPIPNDPRGRSFVEGIFERLGRMALTGDRGAMRELFDRAEGRPRQSSEISECEDPLRELIEEMNRMSDLIGPPEGMEKTINEP